jgi:4-diphosphocytidyl-2-C-methyl-D-erythritol kinase
LPTQNLVIKAAKLLQTEAKTDFGAQIKLTKNIPIGGGLGGGSSDAATTLIALNEIWGIGFSKQKLMQLGLKLGADVPVFVNGCNAWAQGIGEILTPIKLPQDYFLVVSIKKNISTKQIFSSKKLTMTPKIERISSFAEIVNPHNDCLKIAIELEKDILNSLNHLKYCKNYLYQPRMTGSGSCVFLQFKNKKDALVALDGLPKKWTGFVAAGYK